MKTKLNTLFWLLVLLALSIMSGFLNIFTKDPSIPRSDYPLITLIGTALIILIFGGISFVLYYFLKRRHAAVARKRAFQVYGFLVAALTIMGFTKFNETIIERNKYELKREMEPEFIAVIKEKYKNSNDPKTKKMLKDPDLLFHYVDIEMQFNKPLYSEFLTAENLRDFIFYNKAYNEIEKRCIDEINEN